MNPDLRASAAHVVVDDIDVPVIAVDDLHHLSRVLRLRAGERVSVTDGCGAWRLVEWTGGSVDLIGPVHRDRRTAALTVAAALPKGERLEWMVEKLTELGVDRIVLLHCDRGVVRWEGERAARVLDRLRRLVRAAAAQSRRVWLPVIDGPVEATSFLAGASLAVLCDPSGPAMASCEPLPGCLVIGPEGGFSPAELATGHPRVALGPTILRVETAALAAAAQWTALCPTDHGA